MLIYDVLCVELLLHNGTIAQGIHDYDCTFACMYAEMANVIKHNSNLYLN